MFWPCRKIRVNVITKG